jgi:hypothetical protein
MAQLRTAAQALAFVKRHGAVLISAQGPLPNLAEAIAGEPIRGSWWGHPQGRLIFRLCEALADARDVLSFKLVGGKLTFVHRRLWPALVKLAARFESPQLARVWSEHTPSGAHRARSEPFPEWVPPEVKQQARSLSPGEAEKLLAPLLGAISPRAGAGRLRRAAPRRRAGRRRSRTGSS